MKILTVAIPTYNRAPKLDDQIKWLVNDAKNHWDDIEFIVLDNCSPDETSLICSKWITNLGERIKVIRNDNNIGLIGNVLKAIDSSNSKYVWVVGDDDPIKEGTISKVLKILFKHNEEINLLHLNHRVINGYQGDVVVSSFYTQGEDIYTSNQSYKAVNTLLNETHTGGFMFITANVMHRERALEITSRSNKFKKFLAFPMYLNIKLACTGGFYFHSEVNLDCVYNQSSWSSEYTEIHSFQIPTLLMKLKEDGLDANLIDLLIKKNTPKLDSGFIKRALNYFKPRNFKKLLRLISRIFRMLLLKLKMSVWKIFRGRRIKML